MRHIVKIILLVFVLVIIGEIFMKNKIPNMNSLRTNVLFIHHSTGGNLLNHGRVRDEIKKISSNIDLWDHNYNLNSFLPNIIAKAKFLHRTGLSGPNGNITGIDYNINLNNNDPRDYERIFTSASEEETRNKILQFDIIIFKKCFPTSQIESDIKLENFKNSYLNIKNFIDSYPDKLFIIMTQPPLRSEVTNAENANRARNLSNWLQSIDFIGGKKNIKVFDFFALLADENGENQNMLKREYAPWFYRDSHPNIYANKTVATIFANFIANEINSFKK